MELLKRCSLRGLARACTLRAARAQRADTALAASNANAATPVPAAQRHLIQWPLVGIPTRAVVGRKVARVQAVGARGMSEFGIRTVSPEADEHKGEGGSVGAAKERVVVGVHANLSKLYIGNLPQATGEGELKAFIESVAPGALTSLVIPRNQLGQCRGFAFAEFASPAAGSLAMDKLSAATFGQRSLLVRFDLGLDPAFRKARTDSRAAQAQKEARLQEGGWSRSALASHTAKSKQLEEERADAMAKKRDLVESAKGLMAQGKLQDAAAIMQQVSAMVEEEERKEQAELEKQAQYICIIYR